MKPMKRILIATAAFIAVLAIPACAEIVYTPVNVGIGVDGHYHIDLNGDGITDFTIKNTESNFCGGYSDQLVTAHPKGNKMIGNWAGAAALAEGIEVGPNQSFSGHGFMAGYSNIEVRYGICFRGNRWWGNWIGVNSAYLGVEFLINGEIHYGWIASGGGLTPTVTGFAFETVAGQSIVTGQTSGPLSLPIPVFDAGPVQLRDFAETQ